MDEIEHDGVSRRSMLKRGAAVGVAAAWAVPVISVVSMTPAHAETGSTPRGVVPPVDPITPPGGPAATVSGSSTSGDTPTATVSPSTSVAAATASGSSSGVDGLSVQSHTDSTATTPLASTGTKTAVGPTVLVGAAAVALGVGAVAASRLGRPATEDPEPKTD